MSCRELWFVAPRRVELRSGEASAPRAGEILARAFASGVSQGTELLLYRGEGPEPFDPSLEARPTATYPRRYGYAWVGEVIDAPGAPLSPGTHVFALAPHGDVHVAPASSFRPLPSTVPVERAVLAANMETAVNVVWDAGIALGDHVVVVGGGVVGLLCGFAARRGGASRVTLIEPSPRRRQAGLKLGFDEVLAAGEANALEADIVVEASGNPACLDLAIAQARFEGVVVVASFYGERRAPVALGNAFHRRRLTLRSSQVSHLPSSRRAGWSFARRFELVTELLGEGALDSLLEAPTPLEAAPQLYQELCDAPGERLQSVLCYEQ